MVHFVDTRAALVNDALDGLAAASGGRLAWLDGEPSIRVVPNAERDAGKVAIVSGEGPATSRPMPASSGPAC